MNKRNILIVEDEVITSMWLEMMLKKANHIVTDSVVNGDAAIASV